jgi:hypothetical protein
MDSEDEVDNDTDNDESSDSDIMHGALPSRAAKPPLATNLCVAKCEGGDSDIMHDAVSPWILPC